MNDIDRYILLNQSMILTGLAQLMDRYGQKEMANHLDEASIKTNEFIKSFDNAASQEPLVADPWGNINTTANVNTVQTHHRAGKVWMRHKETRELVSIPLTEITMYEKQGFERGGPRSK